MNKNNKLKGEIERRNEQNELNMICIWLIKTLCISTNADEATYTLNGFHNKQTGENLGDWEIIVRKKLK